MSWSLPPSFTIALQKSRPRSFFPFIFFFSFSDSRDVSSHLAPGGLAENGEKNHLAGLQSKKMETKGGEAPTAEMFRVNVKTLDGKVHPVEVAATVRHYAPFDV
jgi:hypothetical protein